MNFEALKYLIRSVSSFCSYYVINDILQNSQEKVADGVFYSESAVLNMERY